MTRRIGVLLAVAGAALCATPAWAAPKVTQVAFAGGEKTLDLVVRAERPIDPTRVEKALAERGRLLELRIGGVEHPKPRLIKHKDPQVVRIQAANARRRAPAALVRIRLKRPLDRAAFDGIKLGVKGSTFVARVPRDSAAVVASVVPKVVPPAAAAAAVAPAPAVAAPVAAAACPSPPPPTPCPTCPTCPEGAGGAAASCPPPPACPKAAACPEAPACPAAPEPKPCPACPQGLAAEAQAAVAEPGDPMGAVWRSAVAPGWGQIHNGHTGRGIGYATVAGGLLVGAAVSVALGLSAESDYQSGDPSTLGRRDDANSHYDRANLLFAVLGAVWVGNVVDAWLSAGEGG